MPLQKDGKTLLMRAALRGHEEVVLELLENGASVDAADVHGRTALHNASMRGHAEIVRHLLQYGANARSRDADGGNALKYAVVLAPKESVAETRESLIEGGLPETTSS